MINRSTLKYTLKKILPKSLFTVVLLVWRNILLCAVEKIDSIRVKKFTTYHAVTLTHRDTQFSLFISPKNGFIDKHIFLYGVYEPFMLDLFSVYLKKSGTFVDIGANIGQHSMYAASIVGETGAVHAFEPIPAIHNQIQDSVRENHFENIVHIHPVALGEHEKDEKLYVSKNVGGSSLVNDDETKEVLTVHVRNGDEQLALVKNIDVIKIDVEGYEYEVLSGIRKTLHIHKPTLFLEFSGEFYSKQNNNHGQKILALLRECGYTLFDIEDDMKKIIHDTAFDHLISTTRKQTNLLCVIKNK